MSSESDRMHGVTPGQSHRYATRTAETFARFALPYLQPGMRLLDIGCGPGSITFGLAEAVSPGRVIGIDHDAAHIESARQSAASQGIDNATFEIASVYEMPFDDNSFDAAFEHAVFIHLPDPVAAAQSVFKVLKPGGLFAARDTATDGHMFGNTEPLLREGYEIYFKWMRHRGSDLQIGRHLRAVLRQAGFESMVGSASYDSYGAEPESIREHGTTMAGVFSGPLTEVAIEQGWADKTTLDAIAQKWLGWRDHPDSFVANAMGEVIGWKPTK